MLARVSRAVCPMPDKASAKAGRMTCQAALPNAAEVAGDQRVEEQEAGDLLDAVRIRNSPGNGEERQKVREQQHQNHGPDKAWRRDSEHRDHADGVVDPGASPARGRDAERKPDHDHHRAGDEDQLERGRQKLRDVHHHGPVGVERDAEVALGQLAEEVPVLGRDRLVEAKLGAQLRDLTLRLRSARAQCGRDRPGITRATAKISIETPSRTMQEIPTRRTKMRIVGVTTPL